MILQDELISGTSEFVSKYVLLSEERKRLQASGDLPSWVITPGYQMLKAKYLDEGETLKQRYSTIAATAAKYMPDPEEWETTFFDLMWEGRLALSTPILSSMGKEKGCPVSCSSNAIEDSIHSFYTSQLEVAMLSKNGFGTSSYLGDIRPRGSAIKGSRGTSSGVLPVYKAFVQVSRDVSQGSVRRGAWAGYLPIDHPDFYEVYNFIHKYPDDANIGWCITSEFTKRLENGDEDAIQRYQDIIKLRMTSGKGYLWFPDKVDKALPPWYKELGLVNKGSSLCNETLPVLQEDETYTCVLSSLNCMHADSWYIPGDTTIFDSFVFLHCVALNFIEIGKEIPGLENAVRYTKNHMSLGLGLLGFHSYLQSKSIPFESLGAHYKNIDIFRKLNSETNRATNYLAVIFGEAPVTEGWGVANALRIAIAPNLSSALICGGLSQGYQ